MRSFEGAAPGDGIGVSLKVRATSGCFHREHSPEAYVRIDRYLSSLPQVERGFEFLEHESGPEVLVLLAVVSAGLGLAKSVVDLIVTIIQARREGVEDGDVPAEPVELIARRYDVAGTLREEVVLRVDRAQRVDRSEIEAGLSAALDRIADEAGVHKHRDDANP